MPITVGQKAPDFTLKGHDDKEYTLSGLRGKNVILAFYPLDFSPVCTKENTCFRDDLRMFNDAGAQVFGVSVDSVWTHKAFAKELGLAYPLLADFHPKGDMAKKYGLYLEDKGITARATVIIDKDGVIRHVEVYDIPQQRDNAKLLEALKNLPS
jgi:peroxiredoxin